jgi:hypothetical protein
LLIGRDDVDKTGHFFSSSTRLTRLKSNFFRFVSTSIFSRVSLSRCFELSLLLTAVQITQPRGKNINNNKGTIELLNSNYTNLIKEILLKLKLSNKQRQTNKNMAEFAPQPLQMGIGNDILDIGSRKARRRGADPMMMGTPGQFDVPNVSNVSSLSYHIISYHIIV